MLKFGINRKMLSSRDHIERAEPAMTDGRQAELT